jgi:hypothetical protein
MQSNFENFCLHHGAWLQAFSQLLKAVQKTKKQASSQLLQAVQQRVQDDHYLRRQVRTQEDTRITYAYTRIIFTYAYSTDSLCAYYIRVYACYIHSQQRVQDDHYLHRQVRTQKRV